MFETIAVLVVFFFLIGFGITFYFIVTKSAAKKDIARTQELRIIEDITKISKMPELECIQAGIQKKNCYDLFKLKAFADQLTDINVMDEYFEVFGTSTVTVSLLFPFEEEVVLYDNPLDDSGYEVSIHPVMVYEPVSETFAFAITEVKSYER